MNTEFRFLLAVVLMVGVLVGTNFLFPPIPPDEAVDVPVNGAPQGAAEDSAGAGGAEAAPASRVPTVPGVDGGGEATGEAPRTALPGGSVDDAPPPVGSAGLARTVSVEGPLYRYRFSTQGARLVGADMKGYESFRHDGPVDLLPVGSAGTLGQKLVVGRDTLDLSELTFEVTPTEGLTLTEGGEPQALRFVYQHPTNPFRFEVEYAFEPGLYQATVRGRVTGLDRPLLVTRLGDGLAFAEVDSAQEVRSMAYVANHSQEGIDTWPLSRDEARVVEGPMSWVAFRNKFFVMALVAGAPGESGSLGGMLVAPSELDDRTEVQVAQSVGADGEFAYRMFMGPQEHTRLLSLGSELEEVNPYGWAILRPVLRPIVGVIMWTLTFLHERLSIGYGWVLVIFGVGMRLVLWPLNQKAMRASLRNMAVQPLMQDIQKRYKDQPEKMQKEMMRLYKEHGFNPLAGCWPMLLPFPVLIALFFVFQNAVEFRGVPFLWLPDLSAADPLYILPLFLALSMFLMQYVSYKSLDTPNPQMKMMMYIMPLMMGFIFLRLPSGLNLYYATANIATIPQQMWIAGERKKMRQKPPLKLSSDRE